MQAKNVAQERQRSEDHDVTSFEDIASQGLTPSQSSVTDSDDPFLTAKVRT